MSDLRNQGPWFNQYHKEYPKWSELYNERYGGRNRLYKFDMDELADLLRISFPLYHNCAIAGQPIKAHKLLSFITESYDNEIGGLRLKDIKDIIKVNYKKNDIIDIEQAFNIFKLLLQKNWDLDPNQSDICTRQILCVFGSRVGYTFESLSKPGIQISDEYVSDSSSYSDDSDSSSGSGSSGEEDSEDDVCSCGSDEECSECEDLCSCGSDEECSQCEDLCSCASDEECSQCASDSDGSEDSEGSDDDDSEDDSEDESDDE